MLGQTAKQGYLKYQMRGSPQAPQPPSLASPCPTDPGTEATKDIGEGARAPRDSEVSMVSHRTSAVLPPPAPARQATALDAPGTHCAPQGPDGAGELGAEACAVHALFLILHSGNILDSGPGDADSKQADVQTLSLAFEAVTRIHFPEALGHVALRLVPCPPVCAAAYALVSKYWSGVDGWGDVQGLQGADGAGLQGPERPHEEGGGGQEARHLGWSPTQLDSSF